MIKFEIILGKAYYKQGFFNIRKKHSEIFGPHLDPIKIFLDENELDNAYVNRTANINNTPRIMAGVEMTRWIQENFKEKDIMLVEFDTKKKIITLKNK